MNNKSEKEDIKFNLNIPIWRLVTAVVIVGLGVATCLLSSDPNTASQAGVKMILPNFLGNMVGEPEEVSAAERKILPSDTEFARKVYHSHQGDRILCSIVLAGGQKRSIHRPEVCLPGQGWTVKSGKTLPIQLKNGKVIEVMVLDIVREVKISGGQRKKIHSYYLYWFVGKGITTPHHWERVFLTSWDRILHNLNHRWAYVIVSSTVTDQLHYRGKNSEQTIEMLKNFISEIAPEFMSG